MKKKMYIFIVCCVLMSFFTRGQRPNNLDTIYANDKMNVSLFFPDFIRQGITGSEHIVFSYNREKKQYFGLLQARPGHDSNLLVITGDGQVYSYIIKYKDSIAKLNYFVSKSESIGNEVANLPLINNVTKVDTLNNKRLESYEKFSRYLLGINFESHKTKRKKGIVLKLKQIRYYKDAVFVVMELKNKSDIDFELDYLNIYKVSTTKKRKASYQKIQFPVIYKMEYPKMVSKGKTKNFVYVLSKFSLSDHERFQFELGELKGYRQIVLTKH
ncbi:DUF4138 domain-containing protein [uncultured Formosa sp.]|uniref:DUF4138 domain-containing protein n=1 Tax=uncultured Formosa sp. TaxID=255435 RepID=UPI002626570F|nr:DUF4138 domain-containing protein [uncultured Formosa sp.]